MTAFYSAGGYAMPIPIWRPRMDFNGAAQDTQPRREPDDDYEGDDYETHMRFETRKEVFI